ncbi:MAG: triose-phosphate isomerase [Alphaproteobacteria bacterium]|nr:triose-phosphate isomerase [Alphaproteobacteria bacterium SS10]MBV6634270.1 triose-phosphate isomerase [Alphaproteobacteria bacterium SS10]
MASANPAFLIAGNWKMHGTMAMADQLTQAIQHGFNHDQVKVVLCPTSLHLTTVVKAAAGSGIGVGSQTCHTAETGAHTGDVAAAMIADAGASYAIVGHSERRTDHGETDEMVCAQAEAALAAGLTPIICIGETEAERDAGEAEAVVKKQIAGSMPTDLTSADVILAYEPVWAIGTGRTPSNDDIEAIHTVIAQAAAGATSDKAAPRILYGGSVKPGNASEILPLNGVGGALVGGASLKAEDFLGILTAAAGVASS